jgi:hypothetical protein
MCGIGHTAGLVRILRHSFPRQDNKKKTWKANNQHAPQHNTPYRIMSHRILPCRRVTKCFEFKIFKTQAALWLA